MNDFVVEYVETDVSEFVDTDSNETLADSNFLESQEEELDSVFIDNEDTESSFVELDEDSVFATDEDQRLYDNFNKGKEKTKQSYKEKKFLKKSQANYKKTAKKQSKYTKLQKVSKAKKKVKAFNEFKNTDEEMNKFVFNKGKELVVQKARFKLQNMAKGALKSGAKKTFGFVGKGVSKAIAALVSALGPIGAGLIGLLLFAGIFTAVFATAESASRSQTSLEGNELIIYEYFKNKDFPDIQIAAIMGNWYQESGLDPQAIQNKSRNILDKGGIGLAQWTVRSRKEDGILKYIKSKNRDGSYLGWDNINYQLEYAYMEINPGYSGDAKGFGKCIWGIFEQWMSVTDLNTAVELFCNEWEMPGTPVMEKRIAKAQKYLEKMNGVVGNLDYVKKAIEIASDNTHGYCQTHRLGNPDYDCSSFVYFCLRDTNNLPANIPVWTTSSMSDNLIRCGFSKHQFTSVEELQEGDILLTTGHTEIYCGNGKNVGAHCDTSGGITCKSGKGDQNGKEISVGNCGNGWKYYFRRD